MAEAQVCSPQSSRRPVHRQLRRLTLSLQVYHQVMESSSESKKPLASGRARQGCGQFGPSFERLEQVERTVDLPSRAVPVYEEGTECEMDPFVLRFSHNSVSNTFRNGLRLDDIIHAALDGELQPKSLPPVHAVLHRGRFFVVRGNRRLFIFRVLCAFGAADCIKVVVVPRTSDCLQTERWDACLGRKASKLERLFSLQNEGAWVHVDSQFKTLQLGFEKHAACTLAVSARRGRPGSAWPHRCRMSGSALAHRRSSSA
eukprot:TRINITY_DN106091_c0_g1_i1.p1 TRINITY_DN106091_c0_g1~~TRINITY_DN106091_c0_g1_i1.p1  ORF type:complete len:284 (-),score=27.05 TRINITY_DN106091_c0_g1_i1:341-1114(-)